MSLQNLPTAQDTISTAKPSPICPSSEMGTSMKPNVCWHALPSEVFTYPSGHSSPSTYPVIIAQLQSSTGTYPSGHCPAVISSPDLPTCDGSQAAAAPPRRETKMMSTTGPAERMTLGRQRPGCSLCCFATPIRPLAIDRASRRAGKKERPGAPRQLGHTSRRPQNGEYGDFAPAGAAKRRL